MHFRAITRIVGLLVILFSGTMIVPGLVALIYRDGAGRAFTQTFLLRWRLAPCCGGRIVNKRRTEIPRRVSDCGAVLDRAGERGGLALYFRRAAEPDGDRCLLRVIFRPDDDRSDHHGGFGLITSCNPLLPADAAMVRRHGDHCAGGGDSAYPRRRGCSSTARKCPVR